MIINEAGSAGIRIGYAHVSTNDQNPALQLDALARAGCETIYEEYASGKRDDSAELAHAQKACAPATALWSGVSIDLADHCRIL
ncbi:recombinase family protein [Sphingobium sp. JS3065]|nr:recombinase family protein [Sphingobium sp. JS3065]